MMKESFISSFWFILISNQVAILTFVNLVFLYIPEVELPQRNQYRPRKYTSVR